jgi:hypothetical protein
MIDLIDPARKTIFRFTTDDQSAVEFFCVGMLGAHYHEGGCIFSLPHNTGKRKKWAKYSVTIVKTKVTKKHVKFEMGSHTQKELS